MIAWILVGVLSLTVGLLLFRQDRLSEYLTHLRTYLEMGLAKAGRCGYPYVRLPAEELARVLGSKARTTPLDERFKPGKGPTHPAASSPARRRGMGGGRGKGRA